MGVDLLITAEVQADVGMDLLESINEIKGVLYPLLMGRDYGPGLTEWTVTALVGEGHGPTEERCRYVRRDRHFDCRLTIPYLTFRQADRIRKRQLLFGLLLRSASRMASAKIPDCQLTKLTEDLQALGKARGWTGAIATTTAEPAEIVDESPATILSAPERIAFAHDEFEAAYVGRTARGSQFLVTTPFEPETVQSKRREFLARYLFDPRGALVEARIDELPFPLDENRARSLREARLAEMGPFVYGRIEIAPFRVERFGLVFGLIVQDDLDPDEPVYEMMLGNYMAFRQPWDSGEYDT